MAIYPHNTERLQICSITKMTSLSANVFLILSSNAGAAHHVQEPEVSAVTGLRERASSGHGRVTQSEQHRRYPQGRERTDHPAQPLLDHPAEQHLFEKTWWTRSGGGQVLTAKSNTRERAVGTKRRVCDTSILPIIHKDASTRSLSYGQLRVVAKGTEDAKQPY